jgi:flagellar biosynthesis protein FlhB
LKDSIDESGETTNSEEFFIRFISVLTSFLVVFINVVLGRIIRILSAFEKHETYSKYHLSVAMKLTVAMFINTGVVPLFVNFGKGNWFNSGGLMVDIFYNTLSVSFLSPIFYFFNPAYFIKKYMMFREERKGDNSKMTQRQANLLFEGPALDMAQRYANTMLLF